MAAQPRDPRFCEFYLVTRRPDRREIAYYSIIYPIPRHLNYFYAHFLSTLLTPRVPFNEDTLIQTLQSPEPWSPTITVPSTPDQPIPDPDLHPPPIVPHPFFLCRLNQPPVFTDRLIIPADQGVTRRHIQTPTSHNIDFDQYFSSSPDSVLDFLTLAALHPVSPSVSVYSSTVTPSAPASPADTENPPSDNSIPYSESA